MKTTKFILRALLPLNCLLIVSCDNYTSNQNPDGPILSPKELQVNVNELGEREIKLDLVDTNSWTNPELQALEDKIRESRKKRVDEKLESLKEERLYFSSPLLTLKNNGQKEVTLDVKFKNEIQKIVFLSPKNHSEDFYFERVGGFNERKVRLQGMCIDGATASAAASASASETPSCLQLAVQISYIYKKIRVTEQFIMNTPLNKNKEKDEMDVSEVDDVDVDPSDKDVSSEPPLIDLDEATEQDIDLSAPPEVQSTMDVMLTPPSTESENPSKSINSKPDENLNASRTAPTKPRSPRDDIDLSRSPEVSSTLDVVLTPPTIANDNPSNSIPTRPDDSVSAPRRSPQKPTMNQTRDSKIDSSASLSPAPTKIKPTGTWPLEPKDEIDLSPSPEVTDNMDVVLNAPQDNDQAPDFRSEGDDVELSRTAPAMPSAASTEQPNLDAATTQNPTAPTLGKADDEIEIDISAEEVDLSEPDHSEGNEDLVLGSGQIVFPDISLTNEDDEEEVREEFNVNSAESKKIPKVTTSLRPVARPTNRLDADNRALLTSIKYKTFNQSRGFYSSHAVRGRIKDATQLDRSVRGAVVNSGRRNRHYGSGMMTSVLEFASDRLHSRYPDSPLCINDIAAQNGGALSGHKSHRNGLDADISLPSSANKCSGSFFQSWSGLKSSDSKFMEKNWFFINTLMETERVHAIFVSNNFISSMCTYVKANTNLSKSQRNDVFKKLHHVSGHTKHYHLRLKCNKQNAGCITQGQLTGSTCN